MSLLKLLTERFIEICLFYGSATRKLTLMHVAIRISKGSCYRSAIALLRI